MTDQLRFDYAERWSTGAVVSRQGLASYLHIIRGPGDPERREKAKSLGGNGNTRRDLPTSWTQVRKLFWARWHTARKEHRCGECGATIRPGERYHRVGWVASGEVGDARECALCAELLVELQSGCQMTVHGGVLHDLLEDLCAEDFAQMSPGAAGHAGGLVFAMCERGYDGTQRRLAEWRAKQRGAA